MELTLKELDASNEISLLTVIKISDLAMRRIIAMSKLLSSFQMVCQRDQIALLKGWGCTLFYRQTLLRLGGLTELLILRGVMCFDASKGKGHSLDVQLNSLGSWSHTIYSGNRQINLHVDVLKKTPEQQHYDIHRNFLHTFDERWRSNENVMLILNAIVLFSADRPMIQDYSLIRQIQQMYFNLLRRYLSVECQPGEAISAYQALLQELMRLREVNKSLQLVYNRLNPEDLEPLLKEIFASSQT